MANPDYDEQWFVGPRPFAPVIGWSLMLSMQRWKRLYSDDSMTAGIGNGNTVHLTQVIANAEALLVAILQRTCHPSRNHVGVGIYLFTVADIGIRQRFLVLCEDCSIGSYIGLCGLMSER